MNTIELQIAVNCKNECKRHGYLLFNFHDEHMFPVTLMRWRGGLPPSEWLWNTAYLEDIVSLKNLGDLQIFTNRLRLKEIVQQEKEEKRLESVANNVGFNATAHLPFEELMALARNIEYLVDKGWSAEAYVKPERYMVFQKGVESILCSDHLAVQQLRDRVELTSIIDELGE